MFFIFVSPAIIIAVSLLVFSLKSEKLLIYCNLAISLLLFVFSAAFRHRGDYFEVTAILSFALYGLIIINFISIFVFWKKYKLKSLIPLGISLIGIFLEGSAGRIGYRIRMHTFEKRLPQYEQVVKMIDNKIGDSKLFWRDNDIPQQYRHLAYLIRAEKDKQENLVVEFFWGGGGPPPTHWAFVYRSDGKVPEKGTDFRKDWPFATRINNNWLEVCD